MSKPIKKIIHQPTVVKQKEHHHMSEDKGHPTDAEQLGPTSEPSLGGPKPPEKQPLPPTYLPLDPATGKPVDMPQKGKPSGSQKLSQPEPPPYDK